MAIRGTYHPRTRRMEKPIELSNRQFARFVAAYTYNKIRVTHVQMLLDVIADAVMAALAQGYKVRWRGLCAFEMRVLKAKRRWNGFEKKFYDCDESCRVHISTAKQLTQKVVDQSAYFVRDCERMHPVKNRILRVETTYEK